MSFGIYIHFPYCISKCSYCNFTSFPLKNKTDLLEYKNLIIKEINNYYKIWGKKVITSIYFGGGSPNLLPTNSIEEIITEIKKKFNFSLQTEISIEANPQNLNINKLKQLLNIGINRFSLGVQSFQTKSLNNIQRSFNKKKLLSLIEILKETNTNYSIDLLYNLPYQNIEDLNQDLKILINIKPPHISTYELTLSPNHPWSKLQINTKDQIKMAKLIAKKLKNSNYLQYEISNFALPSFKSKHNLVYWQDQEYWGLGPGSHSYIKTTPWGIRFYNYANLKQYQKHLNSITNINLNYNLKINNNFSKDNLNKKRLFLKKIHPPNLLEELDFKKTSIDYLYTSFRLTKILLNKDIEKKFNNDLKKINKIKILLDNLVSQKYLIKSKKGWRISAKGRILNNQVIDFIYSNF